MIIPHEEKCSWLSADSQKGLGGKAAKAVTENFEGPPGKTPNIHDGKAVHGGSSRVKGGSRTRRHSGSSTKGDPGEG